MNDIIQPAIGSKPTSELMKDQYAQRAGVDVSRIQGEPGNFVVGSRPSPNTVQAQPFTGEQSAPASPPQQSSLYEQGFNKANAAVGYTKDAQGNVFDAQGNHVSYESLPKGLNGKPLTNLDNLPASEARGVVNQYVPKESDQSAKLDNLFQEDPYLTQLHQERQNLSNTTNTSFVSDYQTMAKAAGMDAIDARLIDINKIINGSEDSIRHEIQAAGGFATNRQVLALTNAANKSLIGEYKTLVLQKSMTEKRISTMIGLEEKDRAASDKRYKETSGVDREIAKREQEIQHNNLKQYSFLQKTVGYKGLQDATGGDPYYTSLVEKSLGLFPGGLAKAVKDEVHRQGTPKIVGNSKVGYYQVMSDGSTKLLKTGMNKPVPTSKANFTETQIHKGAANANVSLNDFSNFSPDAKNYFINPTTLYSYRKTIDIANKNGENPVILRNEISSGNLPSEVKDYLVKHIETVFPKPKEQKGSIWNPLNWFK